MSRASSGFEIRWTTTPASSWIRCRKASRLRASRVADVAIATISAAPAARAIWKPATTRDARAVAAGCSRPLSNSPSPRRTVSLRRPAR
ncbi:MAG: hypothetical protein U0802_26800 [Candidatus Binatia bacterium]